MVPVTTTITVREHTSLTSIPITVDTIESVAVEGMPSTADAIIHSLTNHYGLCSTVPIKRLHTKYHSSTKRSKGEMSRRWSEDYGTKVSGKFNKGDHIKILDKNMKEYARGLSSFSSDEI